MSRNKKHYNKIKRKNVRKYAISKKTLTIVIFIVEQYGYCIFVWLL